MKRTVIASASVLLLAVVIGLIFVARNFSDSSSKSELLGRWAAPGSEGGYVDFKSDGVWIGSDGCNEMSGRYEADGRTFSSPEVPAHANVYCSGSFDPSEFVPRTHKIEVTGARAAFIDEHGRVLITLRRAEP